jgi:glycosyltransferase involved in cell wall biosynthesis
VHVRELVRAMAERGHQLTVLAATTDGLDEFPAPAVSLVTDPILTEVRERTAKLLRASGGEPGRAAEIYGLLLNETLLSELESRRAGFDALYERQSLWSLAGLQFARRNGIPYVLEVNAPLTEQQSEYRSLDLVDAARAIERIVFAGADRIVVTTPVLIDYVRSRGGARRKIRVVPCGVSRELLDRARPSREPNKREFVIGFLGTLKPWHGIDVLLQAFARLADLSEDYRLLIVGEGPMRLEVLDFVREHGLRDRVELTGAVDHDAVGAYLDRMDVGLAPYPALPSFYFSPLKVWEYAAGGVPIVAADAGELPKLFPHKEAALLHTPGNTGKIVRYVERLRLNPELGLRLSRRARRVARLHTWDRLAARVERLVESLRKGR